MEFYLIKQRPKGPIANLCCRKIQSVASALRMKMMPLSLLNVHNISCPQSPNSPLSEAELLNNYGYSKP